MGLNRFESICLCVNRLDEGLSKLSYVRLFDPKCFVIAVCDYTHCGNVYKNDVAETSEQFKKIKPPLKKTKKLSRLKVLMLLLWLRVFSDDPAAFLLARLWIQEV